MCVGLGRSSFRVYTVSILMDSSSWGYCFTSTIYCVSKNNRFLVVHRVLKFDFDLFYFISFILTVLFILKFTFIVWIFLNISHNLTFGFGLY